MKSLVFISFVLLFALSCTQKVVDKTVAPDAGYQDPLLIPADALEVPVTGKHGGRVITAIISDPKTFNPIVSYDTDAQTFNQLMGAGLTRLNLVTQQPEPALARSWQSSPDGLTWTFHLRKDLYWSDGHPFSAEDVLFTMQVVNDPDLSSGAQDALTINGKPITWSQRNKFTVLAQLPSTFAPFLRQIDGATVPILPKHKWQSAFEAKKFKETMQVTMNPEDYVGMGPFQLKEYKQGERITLVRNPHFWKKDKEGNRLPYLDEINFLIFPGLDQLQLKIENGEIDTYYNIRAQDVEHLKSKSESLGLKVENIGPSYETEQFFFNQNPGVNPKTGKPYLERAKLRWFTDSNFRRAVSYAIDRNSLVRNALYGQGLPSYGPETPGNRNWYNDQIAKYPYDPAKAMELLKRSAFTLRQDSGGKKKLYDKNGQPVRFSLYTNTGNPLRNLQCNFIVSDLAKLGIDVNYEPLEFNTFVDKITASFDYDAALMALSHDDVDPGGSMNLWLSSGSLHFWHPLQKQPYTPWEKRIDELMNLQLITFNNNERKKYYDEVQRIIGDEQPIIFTITQYVFISAKEALGNLKPSVSRHRTLWNADELYWK